MFALSNKTKKTLSFSLDFAFSSFFSI